MENQSSFDPSVNPAPQPSPSLATPPQTSQSNSKIPLLILFVLIIVLAVVGFVAYKMASASPKLTSSAAPTPTSVHPTLVPTKSAEATPTSSLSLSPTPIASASITPAPGIRQFASTGISLNIPSGWTAVENPGVESTVSVSNGPFTLVIAKDPIFTGGGVGFMFDGVAFDGDKKEKSDITISSVQAVKTTHIISASAFKSQMGLDSSPDDVYGGSVVSTGEAFPPEFKIKDASGKTRRFLIKYEYRYYTESTNIAKAYSINDPECKKAVESMDAIIKSLKLN